MRFTLLGPLSVHDGEGPVNITGRLRRTLLAALLLDAGTPVSADRLAALLWGPDTSAGTAAALHNHLMRLRQALGDEDRVRAVPPGYLIRVEPGELDLHVFTEECAAGRRKLAEKAWAGASGHFGAALDLWRGRPLADIPALADDLRIRELEETHLQALQGRIEADLNLARHHEVLDELRALTEEHPRNEAFRGQLMLALYRAGQPGGACAAYDEYEKSLLDELGLEPGADLRELHEAVLRGDPALSLPPNPNAPRQLPADTRTFTGRAAELAELVAAAGQSTGTLVISALDGMAGIGKTALAVHVAHQIADRFRDGQLFIDLRGHTAGSAPVSAEEALAYLLRSLGVSPQAIPGRPDERAELYRTRLADTRTLIVLDNAAGPDQVRPLLPGSPGCLVLITSRNRMADLDEARSLTLDILGEDEAVALLGKVAGTDKAPADSPAVRELAALCGCVPLALRIVAARLRHQRELTVEKLVAQMLDEGGRLRQLSDGERDLTDVFDAAFASLPEPERNLLRMLGLIPGPDIDAYAAANLLGTELETAGRLLDSLLDRSLLIQQADARYGMHDLVRAYARTLMDAASDEAVAAKDRLLDYYQHTAWSGSRHHAGGRRWSAGPDAEPASDVPELPDLPAVLAWLRAERANLLAAIASEGTTPARRIDLTAAAAMLLRQEGPWPLAVQLHEAAAREALRLGDRIAEADALRNVGQICALLGVDAIERARTAFDAALEIYRESGHRQGEADTLLKIGQARYFQGDAAGARQAAEQALPVFRETGDRHGEAQALQALATSGQLLGHNAQARRYLREAAVIIRELGNTQGEAAALALLGFLECEMGEFPAAAETLEQALRVIRSYGNPQTEAGVLNSLGLAHARLGLHDQAKAELSRALGIYRGAGYEFGTAIVLQTLGQALTAAHELQAAIEHLEQSRELFAANGNQRVAASVMRDLGWARHLAGDAEGQALLERALGEFQGTVQDPAGEAETLVYLGRIAVEDGDPGRALGYFDQAMSLAKQTDQLNTEADALDGIARCHELSGDRETALNHLRRAAALYRRTGTSAPADAEERLIALGGEDALP